MKKKQILRTCSATLLSACLLGGFIASCGSSGKGLPTIEKSTALFDDFTYKGEDDFYTFNPLPDDGYFYNPILPGWYSDPSVCTNGEGDYFLVTSTFTYYPGVPLFHSRDLVNWKQVGHVLDRPSQLVNMEGQGVNGGIFAPAVSYNAKNKTYYMVTTNVGAGNFFVKTQDPFGSWSEPIMLPEVGGIDPSFFFDEDGRAYIVNNDEAPNNKPEYDGHRTIRIQEFDTKTDKTIGDRKVLVNKGACPQDNPILTQRHLAERPNPVTCAGHADLIQAAEGDWWAIFLACRPIDNRFENLGRETFLMPVKWSDDGFPYLTQEDDLIPLTLKRDGVKCDSTVTFGNFEANETFDSSGLGLNWMTLRGSATEFYSLFIFREVGK